MHQAQSRDPQPRRKMVAAFVVALLAIAALPAGAAADGLTVPHAAGSAPPTVPKAVGSGAPTPAPAPSPGLAPSGASGGSSSGGSDSEGWGAGTPNQFGIPNFEFPKPDQPPPGSSQCGPGCNEQWGNYFTAAAQAAQARANETTDPDEADTMGELATALASQAATAYEHRDSEVNNAAAATASPDTSAPADSGAGIEGDEEVPADAVPLGWLVPGESDLSQGLIGDAIRGLEYLSSLFADGTTACPKEAGPDGKPPTCTK